MSRVGNPTLPRPPRERDDLLRYLEDLNKYLTEYLRDVAAQVNASSEMSVAGAYNAQTATPTGIVMTSGDIIRHSDPTEQGATGDKYVVIGWTAITDGTASAGSIVELRVPTGG